MRQKPDDEIIGRESDAPRICSNDPVLQALTALGSEALHRRWRKALGRPMPAGLGRSLALRVLAYREQALRYGDLDLVSQRALAAVLTVPTGDSVRARSLPASSDLQISPLASSAQPLLVRPGTVLVREHGGAMHRVMALDDGFAWNGRTYDSLSKVAFAITGTRWNGPRFFGLRALKGKRTGPRAAVDEAKLSRRHTGGQVRSDLNGGAWAKNRPSELSDPCSVPSSAPDLLP